MAETLQEYLVKIGYKSDTKSFKDITRDLKSVNDWVGGISIGSSKMATNFVKGAASIAGAGKILFEVFYKLNKESAKFLLSVANQDLAIEKLARRYWAAEKSVRAFQYSLNALGETEGDLFYMTDEEYSRFLELNALGKSLESPADVDNTLKKIRDIQFEFQKASLTFEYFKRSVIYYLGKNFGGILDRIQSKIGNINEIIQKNMPKISEQVSRFMSYFLRVGERAIDIINWVVNMIDKLPDNVKDSGAAILHTATLIGTALLGGPVGKVIAALTVILDLLDDFLVWQKGGQSLIDWSFTGAKDRQDYSGEYDDKTAEELANERNNLTKEFLFGNGEPDKRSWPQRIREYINKYKEINRKYKEVTSASDVRKEARENAVQNWLNYGNMEDYYDYPATNNTVNNDVNINIYESDSPKETAREVSGIFDRVNENTGLGE